MFKRSHKFVDIPHTAYERRRELRVRENKHTVMLFDRKYQNIDTGKFDIDKMHSLNTGTIGEIFSGATLQNQAYDYEPVIIDIRKKPIKAIKSYDDVRPPVVLFTDERRLELLANQRKEKRAKIEKERAERREIRKQQQQRRIMESIERKAQIERDHDIWKHEQELLRKKKCAELIKEEHNRILNQEKEKLRIAIKEKEEEYQKRMALLRMQLEREEEGNKRARILQEREQRIKRWEGLRRCAEIDRRK